MDNYFELKISINPNMEEIISDIFFTHFDCEGVVLEEQAYKDLEMTSTTRGTLRVFLTTMPQNLQEVLNTERELLKSRGFSDEELGSWEISLDEKENQDWSKKWKEKWTVTHVTENIAVVPSWLEYNPKPNEITISLDPGCAFGTGTHQTTQLCMKALEKYLNKGDSVADIGTGSGILSILAMKLGAKSAYGCDIDETVIDVCKENAKINNVEVTFELNSADKLTEKYDFVCANILHNVLAEIMGDLKALLKPTAKLSLSGILDEKKDIVLQAIQDNNLKIIDTISQDQWVSYIVTL
ncbi:MAG: 50S ribosomal protein L11 methyltransferase [bacterium]|nr:50S ribosomal protein L11 methyltransferase [bacterium]